MIKQEDSGLIEIGNIEFVSRMRKDLGDIVQLAESIKKYGLLHPPAVKDLGGGKYKLLAGARRLSAAIYLKWNRLKCTIYHRDLTDLELRSIELIENIDRKDLTWQEEDALVREIHNLQIEIYGEHKGTGIRTDLGDSGDPEKIGWSQAKTAELLCKGNKTISAALARARAAELSPRIARCKTKDDANKLLQGARDKVDRKLRVEEYDRNKSNTPEGIIKKNLIDSYIVADAFEKIKSVKSNSIDWIELDPPYGIDLKQTRKSRHIKDMVEYEEVPVESYRAFMYQMLEECSRVLTSEGWLICWFGIDWYDMIYTDILDVGFKTPTLPAIWTKGGYQAQSMQPSIYLGNSYETFFYARKPNAQIQRKGHINEFRYKNITPQYKTHPAERPIEMMVDILSTFCQPNSTGLVPFLGSGNTILAANNLKMHAYGFDLSEDYKRGYIIKVNEGSVGQFRSYKEESG